MRKFLKSIIYTLIVGLIFTCILRFVSYDNLAPKTAKIRLDCANENQPLVDKDGFTILSSKPKCSDLIKINTSYLKSVKPIMKSKCLMCHGQVSSMPLYSRIPPISWLVNHDIKESKEHMDMTYDFPFQGHGTPKDDIKTIQKVILNNEMPPIQYLLMHWQSSLTKKESEILLEWVRESLAILE